MILQPRNFKYKTRQKKRTSLNFKKNQNLKYGDAGLLLLKPIQLTAKHMFRFKLFLKKAMRKSDRTRRFFWFNAFPHLPLTKKPDGLRMGKGKGKLDRWFTAISGGVMLFEFKNLRYGRSRYFMRQMTHKLGIRTKQIFTRRIYVDSFLKLNKKFFLRTFW